MAIVVFPKDDVIKGEDGPLYMSIKAEFADGVFKPLEKVDNIPAGAVYTVLSEDELRGLAPDLEWLKASEKSFEFCDNPEDAVYDNRTSSLSCFHLQT